jgi:formylglycine-generating enzyme required for sulfatase activity
MHGNVWEWCLDWYEVDATANGGKVNIDSEYPEKTLSGASGANRMIRGGSFGDAASACRSALRTSNVPNKRGNSIGFRVVCSVGLR